MTYFQFEADFVSSLRCIPMQVRLHLDTCGIKLKLEQWHRLTQEQRLRLVEMPCRSPTEIAAYRDALRQLVRETAGVEATPLAEDLLPVWEDPAIVPPDVVEQAQQHGIAFSTAQWAKLSTLERFALVKLSRSHHENHNFLPALREFRSI